MMKVSVGTAERASLNNLQYNIGGVIQLSTESPLNCRSLFDFCKKTSLIDFGSGEAYTSPKLRYLPFQSGRQFLLSMHSVLSFETASIGRAKRDELERNEFQALDILFQDCLSSMSMQMLRSCGNI